jgi:hypothetical protein
MLAMIFLNRQNIGRSPATNPDFILFFCFCRLLNLLCKIRPSLFFTIENTTFLKVPKIYKIKVVAYFPWYQPQLALIDRSALDEYFYIG